MLPKRFIYHLQLEQIAAERVFAGVEQEILLLFSFALCTEYREFSFFCFGIVSTFKIFTAKA